MPTSRFRQSALALVLAAMAAVGGVRAAAAAPPPIPVIIDTDAGDDIDDAFAIGLAVSDPRLKVLGVTTAWGDTHKRALLVRRLLAAAGRRDIPVFEGPATETTTPFTQAKWADGETDRSAAPDAIAFIAAQAERAPGEVTLVELAPMSNLQALMQRFPGAAPKLKQVAFMGGSLYAGYQNVGAVPNPQPSAEYNVAMRPAALDALLRSGARAVMFPLDSTQLRFDEVRRDRLFAHGSGLSDALTLLYHQWRLGNAWGQLTPTLFDAVPVAWLLDPTACPVTPLRIAVDRKGFTRPITGPANVEACLKLHDDAAQRLIMDDLSPDAG